MSEQLQARFPVVLNGVVATIVSGSGVAPYTYANGLKIDANGNVVINNTGGGVTEDNGRYFDSAGELICTASPTAPTVWDSGLQFDANRALCVSTSAVVTWQNGLPFDANGYLCVTNAPVVGGSPVMNQSSVDVLNQSAQQVYN